MFTGFFFSSRSVFFCFATQVTKSAAGLRDVFMEQYSIGFYATFSSSFKMCSTNWTKINGLIRLVVMATCLCLGFAHTTTVSTSDKRKKRGKWWNIWSRATLHATQLAKCSVYVCRQNTEIYVCSTLWRLICTYTHTVGYELDQKYTFGSMVFFLLVSRRSIC